MYQLLSVTYKTYRSFDNDFEIRVYFLISRKFSIKFGTKV